MTTYDVLYMLGKDMLMFMGIAAGVAAVMPPPAEAEELKTKPNLIVKIRATRIYRIAYKFFNVCGSNLAWAKNFADPKQRAIVENIISIILKIRNGVAGGAVIDSSLGQELAPVVSHFKLSGDPVVTVGGTTIDPNSNPTISV